MINEETRKKLALDNELRTSIKLIKLGFGEYQNLNTENDFYFLPFQLLSSGFERLLKCHICLGHLEKEGSYPEAKLISKKLGHDLLKLKKHIIENHFNTQNISKLYNDLEYLKDRELEKLLSLLSEFGKYARYYNLDIVTGAAKPSENTKLLWEDYETELMKKLNLISKLESNEQANEAVHIVTREIIIKLERFVRAITRQFTLGRLGQQARMLHPHVSEFIQLRDEEFGNTNYRSQTTRYNARKKAHKNTFWNKLKVICNRKRVIKKKNFNGDWPFCHEKVVVECWDEYYYIVVIKGKPYALNGLAQARYKFESVHDAGMAIIGKSIDPFIDIAKELAKNNK